MTEDEAKRKWCPTGAPRAWDRPMQREDTRCIGSACMAWRWGTKPNPDYTENFIYPDQRSPNQKDRQIRDPESGGCGLAGAPQ